MQLLDMGKAFNQQHVIKTTSDSLLSVSSHATCINHIIHLTCAPVKFRGRSGEAEIVQITVILVCPDGTHCCF